uniref:Uncharacterized protein n=1 Tax=Babesia bovis TaxID=5865 RepID=A7APK4_BABBO|eukprot:XP_001612056.1 hypothetical protein [Babesia bovis T2Bo]
MERQSVGVQTNWEEKNDVPSLEELQHRLCKLITDCGTDNDVPNMRSPTDMESSLHYNDIKNMTPVTSKQTEFLPKDGVTNITAKNEETYAVAMFCNRSGRGCNAIGEVYVSI